MSVFVKINFYGTDSPASSDYPLLTDVAALAGYVTCSYELKTVHATPTYEVVEMLDGFQNVILSKSFKPETELLQYESATSFESFYNTSVFSKPYLYCDLVGYKLNSSSLTTGKTMRIKWGGSYEVNENDSIGRKSILWEFEAYS